MKTSSQMPRQANFVRAILSPRATILPVPAVQNVVARKKPPGIGLDLSWNLSFLPEHRQNSTVAQSLLEEVLR